MTREEALKVIEDHCMKEATKPKTNPCPLCERYNQPGWLNLGIIKLAQQQVDRHTHLLERKKQPKFTL